MEHIGFVEIVNRSRIYPLDPYSSDQVSEAVVEPGVKFPLYRDGLSYFWIMVGKLNAGKFQNHGDGLFTISPEDKMSDIEVVFPSKRYGEEEWHGILADPISREGDPEQRLRITIDKED